jgi:hypothetical protein
MSKYTLGSSGLIHAPGFLAWVIRGYQTGDKSHFLSLLTNGWGLPLDVATQVASGELPYKTDGDTVIIEVPEHV